MINGSQKSQLPEADYQAFKVLIFRYINDELSEDDYADLRNYLTLERLRYFSVNEGHTLLYWTLHAAFNKRPRLFIDIWALRNWQFSIEDFRSPAYLLGKCASPHWAIAATAHLYPDLYTAFFNRFYTQLNIDDFAECIPNPENPSHTISIFEVVASAAIQHPRPFMKIWSSFRTAITPAMLCANNGITAHNKVTPLTAICDAIKLGSLDPEVLHFCLQQMGDCQSGLQESIQLTGNIVHPTPDGNVRLISIGALVHCKNHFFDMLALRENAVQYDDGVRKAAQTATDAGFYNAYFHLAYLYKQLQCDDLAYEVLMKLPTHSTHYNSSLASCTHWYLQKAKSSYSLALRETYYQQALFSTLKMTDHAIQVAFLQNIAYHFMNEGEALPAGQKGPLTEEMLQTIKSAPDVKAVLSLLKGLKTSHDYNPWDRLDIPAVTPPPPLIPLYKTSRNNATPRPQPIVTVMKHVIIPGKSLRN